MRNDYIGARERCSKCGSMLMNVKFEYVLRPNQDKQIIKRLFERKLEEYICPKCGEHNTKEINSLEYVDDEKRFKVFYRRQAGTLMKIYRDLINNETNDNPMDFFGGSDDDSQDYRYYGATDLDEVITAICAFENDLDIKVVWLVLHDLAKQLDKEDKGLVIYGLTYDEDHNLVCEFKEKESDEHVFNKFPFKKYEDYKEKYSDQLKLKLDFDFGYKAAVNFFKRLDRLEGSEKETKFALTNNGVLALIPSYVGEVKPGDMVVVNDNDYVLVQGVDEVMTLKNNTINFDYDEIEYPFVQNIGHPLKLNDMLSKEDVGSNEELCKQLNKCAETEVFKDIPYAELLDETLYVPCSKADDGEIIPMVKDDVVAVFASNKLKIGPNFMKIKFKDLKKYLEMYADPETIEGVVFIHTGEKQITFLSMHAIFKAPVKCLMEDENHMKMMLSTLEKPYKQYLTFNKETDAYKAISFMYFNNHENKQFQIAQEELGVDEKTIHRMLDFGYVRLQRIVKSRF